MNAYMKRKHKKELRAPVHNMWTLEKPICGCVFFSCLLFKWCFLALSVLSPLGSFFFL